MGHSLNIPTILVTHGLEEAYELADTMTILHHGATLQSATPEEVINRPHSAQVARLVRQNNAFSGQVLGRDETAGVTLLKWRDLVLRCRPNRQFSAGQRIQWMVPQNRIILHQRVRPSKGEPENPVEGYVSELVTLGHWVALEITVAGGNQDATLSLSVPLHVAERNSLSTGEIVGISLKIGGIHIMESMDSQRRNVS